MSELIKQARYEYERLPSDRSIRLIRFRNGHVPVCRIITVEVEKAPPYVALSYTWGSKELSRTILVNGREVPVTVNLAEAIDAIFTFASAQNMMFWADSICINQADTHERGRQVALMNTIYRSAEIVAIWLGPAADKSDVAFDQMPRWKARLDVLKQKYNGSESLAIASITPNDRFFFGLPGSREYEALEGLRMILRRHWWERAWIVQEGTIARPERTRLFCGDRVANWLQLRIAIYVRYHVAQHLPSKLSGSDATSITLDNFRLKREIGMKIRLVDALRIIRSHKCEDPRDKVYAALGMAMDVMEKDIIPDYTESYQSLFVDVIKFYMSKENLHVLDVLGEACKSAASPTVEHDHDDTLPSWVPDWTSQSRVVPFGKSLDADTFDLGEPAYNASAVRSGKWSIIDEELHIQGSFLDVIVSVSSFCHSTSASFSLDIERSWQPEDPDRKYFTGETVLEAFNHTLTADIGRRSDQMGIKFSRGFSVDWTIIDRKDTITAEMKQQRRRMFSGIKLAIGGRRFIETKQGFIGLAPAAAQIGDDICVFLGGQVLYVVRPRGDGRYEYVGESYVHGMMDGWARQKEYFSLRDFVLW